MKCAVCGTHRLRSTLGVRLETSVCKMKTAFYPSYLRHTVCVCVCDVFSTHVSYFERRILCSAQPHDGTENALRRRRIINYVDETKEAIMKRKNEESKWTAPCSVGSEWWSLPQNARTAHTLASLASDFFFWFYYYIFQRISFVHHLRLRSFFCSFFFEFIYFSCARSDKHTCKATTYFWDLCVYYLYNSFLFSTLSLCVQFQCVLWLQSSVRVRARTIQKYTVYIV